MSMCIDISFYANVLFYGKDCKQIGKGKLDLEMYIGFLCAVELPAYCDMTLTKGEDSLKVIVLEGSFEESFG